MTPLQIILEMRPPWPVYLYCVDYAEHVILKGYASNDNGARA